MKRVGSLDNLEDAAASLKRHPGSWLLIAKKDQGADGYEGMVYHTEGWLDGNGPADEYEAMLSAAIGYVQECSADDDFDGTECVVGPRPSRSHQTPFSIQFKRKSDHWRLFWEIVVVLILCTVMLILNSK